MINVERGHKMNKTEKHSTIERNYTTLVVSISIFVNAVILVLFLRR